jgi:hypothetical protein
VHREPGPLEQQRQLAGRNGGTAGSLGEGLQHAHPPALKAANDQVQANPIAEQRAQLRVIAFNEEHTVALIGVGAQQVRLAKQTVRPPSEIDTVLRQKHAAGGYRQHASLLCCGLDLDIASYLLT